MKNLCVDSEISLRAVVTCCLWISIQSKSWV